MEGTVTRLTFGHHDGDSQGINGGTCFSQCIAKTNTLLSVKHFGGRFRGCSKEQDLRQFIHAICTLLIDGH
jgi:hypothetical protein